MTPAQLRKRIAVGFIVVLLVVVLNALLYQIPQANERLIAEIQQSLGASTLLECMGEIQEGRDPAYYPLLNRQPLREFVRRNPRTLTEKQKLEGVKFQYFTDRYRQIWSLTKESEAGNSPVVKGLNSPLDPYLDLKHEFEGMIQISVPTSDDLSLDERVEWAIRSLEFIEGYLGAGVGLMIDAHARNLLINDWISMCRFLLVKIDNPGQLRQLAAAIEAVEPPLVAFKKTLRLEHVALLERVLRIRGAKAEGALLACLREPDLNYGLSQMKSRILKPDEPSEYIMHLPWYSIYWSTKFQPHGGHNPGLMASRHLEAGIEFFRDAIDFRIAQLEGGESTTSLSHSRVETSASGEVWVIWNGDPPQHPYYETEHLFDPYRFPQ